MMKLRTLFAVTALVFGVQFAYFLGTGREPYPALFLPWFGGSPLSDNEVAYSDPKIDVQFADGTTESVRWKDVIPQPTFSAASAPGAAAFSTLYKDAQSDPATAAWLADRVAGMFPGRQVTGVDIHWRQGFRDLAGYPIRSEEISNIHLNPTGR